MKPVQLLVPNNATTSFSVRKDTIPNVNNRWHCHSEVELICFHQGAGTQFVGDNIKRFKSGDIVLVGANLPHYWRYDQSNQVFSGLPYSTAIHFSEGFLGERFLHLPESKSIKDLLQKAKRGIYIYGHDAESLAPMMEGVYKAEGLRRIMLLMECLLRISEIKHPALLSSLGFKYDHRESENERLNTIYEFSSQNFREKVVLDEVAALINLTRTSFCRYFKSRTGKTYTQFLTDIRVGYACKLLLENRYSIKQISFESGFNNFTSFHDTFKAIVGKTPKNYRDQHLRTT